MNTISAMFLSLVTLIFVMAWYTYKTGQEFEEWYQELLKQSPYYGFTDKDINDFERGVWWSYHADGLSPEEAIKKYLSEN